VIRLREKEIAQVFEKGSVSLLPEAKIMNLLTKNLTFD